MTVRTFGVDAGFDQRRPALPPRRVSAAGAQRL